MSPVQGHCDDKFSGVKALLEKELDGPDEVGASIFVNHDGKDVVDIWGGFKDEAKTEKWEKDTIVNVYSSTKTLVGLVGLILHDRGLLDLDEKVSKYWPEFAANGKENILVRHFLSHTSGVSGWEEQIQTETLYDFPAATALLAAQAPWWEPGTASGYHALTMGFLVGELVRRVTGKSFTEFVAKEIAEPLGADFQVGAAEADWPRISNVIPPATGLMDGRGGEAPKFMAKTFGNPQTDATKSWTPGWRNAEIGAANGHSNARGMAKALSVITLGGEVDGKRLLSQKTIDRIFEEQSYGPDLVIGAPLRFGIGFGIAGSPVTAPTFPDGKVCFWGGWGGSVVIMDLDNRLTITYAMNKMKDGVMGNSVARRYVREIYAAMGIELAPNE